MELVEVDESQELKNSQRHKAKQGDDVSDTDIMAYSTINSDAGEDESAFTEKGAITEAFDQENPELAKKAK